MIKSFALAGALLGVVGAANAQPMVANPYVELYDSHDWTMNVTVNIRAYTRTDPNTRMPVREDFDFDTAAVVFPLLLKSASHQMLDADLKSVLALNDIAGDDRPDLLPDYPCGTRLGKWELRDWKGEEVELRVSIASTCWKTRFNEDAAIKVDWPKGDWLPEANSCFEPQLYITRGLEKPYDMTPVQDLLRDWTNGKDPKSIKPVTLAKFLTGEVIKLVQPSGDGLSFSRTGQLEGINLQGAPETARKRRGSEFDFVCLLAAVFREAGLPCRVVIGYDIGAKKGDDNRLFEKRGSAKLRAWVEFALQDENLGTLVWVPVDALRLRDKSNRTPPLDKPWEFFGTHDELDGVIPFAFQFHPPTTVRAYGSPGFWGWLVTPKPPDEAEQAITFTANTTPVRGSDPNQGKPGYRR